MKQKTIILVIVVLAIVGAIWYLEGTKVSPAADVDNEEPKQLEETNQESNNLKDELYEKAPDLTGIVGHINVDEGVSLEDYRGKVVLVDFWTYSCINCIRTLPYLTAWDEKYRDKGLVIVGVHTPEFEFEKEYGNVLEAVNKYDIQYPVVQDNDYRTWRAYKNRYWPRKYIVDAEGYIRYDHIGEGAYEETEKVIQELLAEIGEEANLELEEEQEQIRLETTHELYAGYDFAIPRGQYLGNEQGFAPDSWRTYVLPDERESDKMYLQGRWQSNPDSLELIGDEGSVFLNFRASEVNIVAERAGESVEAEILFDETYLTEEQAGSDIIFDGDVSKILVEEPDLYNLYMDKYGEYMLEIRAQKGFKLNSFTFGGQIN